MEPIWIQEQSFITIAFHTALSIYYISPPIICVVYPFFPAGQAILTSLTLFYCLKFGFLSDIFMLPEFSKIVNLKDC